jgi:hypothetical protein
MEHKQFYSRLQTTTHDITPADYLLMQQRQNPVKKLKIGLPRVTATSKRPIIVVAL